MRNVKKKIFFITGSRAEYGQFSFFLQKLSKLKNIDFKLIVTGMHLYKNFGSTYKEIIKDNIKIFKKIDIKSNLDSIKNVPYSVGCGIKKFTDLFIRHKPDLVCIPGDRFEMLSAAIACHFNQIPIAHFYGGETSLGSLDEENRNCITLLSKYHFVSNKKHIAKIKNFPNIKRKNIFNIGALALEKIKTVKLFKKKNIEELLSINLNKKNILFTYHPITNHQNKTREELKNILDALKMLDNVNIIFTKPNNDTGNDFIIKQIQKFCKLNPKNFIIKSSLGQKLYYSLIKYSSVVIGNSSSLFYEVPYFGKYSLNIGIRQMNRTQGNSIINLKAKKNIIFKKISEYLNAKGKKFDNPYFKKDSTNRTLKIFKKIIN
jgi:GDP/UDP-N,N'-diacetylbacillosamine 2-epimerase (hydrolysing)